jgi:hypothetical protein
MFTKDRWIYETNCRLEFRVQELEHQLRRTTRDLRTQLTKWTEVDGGVLEYLLRILPLLTFLCDICDLNITFKFKLN